MPLCRFLESTSNLNYKCVIVCSEFFQKIILRYTISDYFTEPSIVLIKLTFSTNSLARHLGLFWQNSNKMKNTPKKEIFWHGVLLCVLVARENDKLHFWQTFHKNPSHKGLSSINMYRFQFKPPRHDHSRGIVCDNLSIFGT